MRKRWGMTVAIAVLAGLGCQPEEWSVQPCGSACVAAAEADAADDGQLWGLYKGVYVDGDRTAAVKMRLAANFDQAGSACDIRYGTDTDAAAVENWDVEHRMFGFATPDGAGCVQPSCYGIHVAIHIDDAGFPTSNAPYFKETSTSLVKVFEGTYSGTLSGHCGFLLRDDRFYGTCDTRISGGDSPIVLGTMTGGTFTQDSNVGTPRTPPTTYQGTVSADGQSIEGTWTNSFGQGTWKVRRTM